MKILWVVSTIFPQLAEFLGKSKPVYGGWMYGMAKSIATSNLELTIVTSDSSVEIDQQIDGIRFIVLKSGLPKQIYDPELEVKWKNIIKAIQPGIIHIHGTEYALGLALLNACPDEKFVVSIQGLLSVIARYYRAGMSLNEIITTASFRDILRFDTIIQAQNKIAERGALEKTYLVKAKNCIGRTTWDHHHTFSLNPKRRYYFCNESLRAEFYNSPKWEITTIKRHSIFLSQAGYPIKGLHQVLKAVHLIRSEFDHIRINIAGNNIIDKKWTRITGYGKYIKGLIKKFHLEDNVVFLGTLNTDEMIREYLKCNAFICPSIIENSPNSLGEAQIIGAPCIAAYVGGVPDMVNNNEDGLLYRFEEVEMLAQNIKEIFENDTLALKLSENGIVRATKRHNMETNLNDTLKIYQSILE